MKTYEINHQRFEMSKTELQALIDQTLELAEQFEENTQIPFGNKMTWSDWAKSYLKDEKIIPIYTWYLCITVNGEYREVYLGEQPHHSLYMIRRERYNDIYSFLEEGAIINEVKIEGRHSEEDAIVEVPTVSIPESLMSLSQAEHLLELDYHSKLREWEKWVESHDPNITKAFRYRATRVLASEYQDLKNLKNALKSIL